MKDKFKINDKVKTPYNDGYIWKITKETIHVQHIGDNKTYYSKYYFNPTHHMQSGIDKIEVIKSS